jgi:16S rRNA (guanine527-N7)-methyltransferase
MEIESSEWYALIAEGAATFNLTVSSEQMAAFALHATTLVRWNERTNLTRIVSPEEMAIRHFVDSLSLVPQLIGRHTIMDMGTGGGFPGMVVAEMLGDRRVVLVDAVRKKVSFLNHLIRLRQSCRVSAVHARTSDLAAHPDYHKRFDAVVSRAMGDLTDTLRAAAPFLKDNACAIAMRGPRGADEARDFMASSARTDIETIAGYPLAAEVVGFQLPRGHGDRYLLTFRRHR